MLALNTWYFFILVHMAFAGYDATVSLSTRDSFKFTVSTAAISPFNGYISLRDGFTRPCDDIVSPLDRQRPFHHVTFFHLTMFPFYF